MSTQTLTITLTTSKQLSSEQLDDVCFSIEEQLKEVHQTTGISQLSTIDDLITTITVTM